MLSAISLLINFINSEEIPSCPLLRDVLIPFIICLTSWESTNKNSKLACRMEYKKSETLPMSFIVIINNNGPSIDP